MVDLGLMKIVERIVMIFESRESHVEGPKF
jgi:hypothetical protein